MTRSDFPLSLISGGRANSHPLGRKLKGQFLLPINSQFPFPRVPEGSFLGCVPDAPAEARAQSITVARDRHMQLMKAAGRSLANDARSAMQDLLGDENE